MPENSNTIRLQINDLRNHTYGDAIIALTHMLIEEHPKWNLAMTEPSRKVKQQIEEIKTHEYGQAFITLIHTLIEEHAQKEATYVKH